MKTQTKAAIFLFIFSSINAELLTGSAPPLEYFSSMGFIYLIPFYGLGAIIVHEVAARWKKGWPTILLLGAAWGIFEEGLVVMSFFNPGWVDLGALGSYGRILGVNWVWTVNLALFHAIWSIAVPILVTRLIFPQVEGSVLLRTQTLYVAFTVLMFVSVLLSLSIMVVMRYAAPVPLYIGAIVVMLLIGLAAKKAPLHLFASPTPHPLRKAGRFYWVGLGFAIGYFVLHFVVSGTGAFFLIDIILILALTAATARYVEKNMGANYNDRHKLALVAGLETVWIAFAFIHELTGASGMIGMSIVALCYIAFLLWVRSLVVKRPVAAWII